MTMVILETERLILRHLEPDDVMPLFAEPHYVDAFGPCLIYGRSLDDGKPASTGRT